MVSYNLLFLHSNGRRSPISFCSGESLFLHIVFRNGLKQQWGNFVKTLFFNPPLMKLTWHMSSSSTTYGKCLHSRLHSRGFIINILLKPAESNVKTCRTTKQIVCPLFAYVENVKTPSSSDSKYRSTNATLFSNSCCLQLVVSSSTLKP